MPDGRIAPRQVERLKEMGAWLAKNGESIYGTRGGPWKPTKAVASTRKGNTVFVHVFRAPDGRVELPDIPRRVKAAARLGGGAVQCRQQAGKLALSFEPGTADALDTIVRLELDGSAMDLPAQSLAPDIKATASNVYQGDGDYVRTAFDMTRARGGPPTRARNRRGWRRIWASR
jgi:hypothetical protein